MAPGQSDEANSSGSPSFQSALIFQQRIPDRPRLSVLCQQIVERLNGERLQSRVSLGREDA
jgi:hypothetical protein